MTTLRFGDLVPIRMDFHQMAGAKVRPAVVLLDTGDDDFVAAPITSRERSSGWDFQLEHWREAGLNVASFVRVHKLAVLAKTNVARSLGTLSQADRDRLEAIVCRTYCPGAKT